jgi:hypothetical protein
MGEGDRMKKIISLFKRNYSGDRLVYNEIVSGAEWVISGEGIATIKFDGTCCMIAKGKLYKRYDRKMTKKNYKRLKNDPSFAPKIEHYKPSPQDWIAAELEPNHHTGHWPGWIPVSPSAPDDKWHREVWERIGLMLPDGTFELVGPKIQNNPYDLPRHELWPHGQPFVIPPPRDFDGLKDWFEGHVVEGIVWHHPDSRMVKIKRSDFGMSWPEG